MQFDYSSIFHQLSKDHKAGRSRVISPDQSQWPEEWRSAYYKVYPRLPKISLPKGPLTADLVSTVQSRKSERAFSDKPITLDELGLLLQYSCAENSIRGPAKRMYPSGGGLYPVEFYVFCLKPINNLVPGLYHYNSQDHSVTQLAEISLTESELKELSLYDWFSSAQFVIFLTGTFSRAKDKYGFRGYRNSLLEAGHAGQNLGLVATALKLKHCIITGTIDDKIELLLDIDGITESLVYGMVFGK